MNITEAKNTIKSAGSNNVRVVPMPGQPFDGDHQIEVKTDSWHVVLSGLSKSMAEGLVREATNKVILG